MRNKNSDKPFAFIILHISNLRDLSATFSPSSLFPMIHICLYELNARSKHKQEIQSSLRHFVIFQMASMVFSMQVCILDGNKYNTKCREAGEQRLEILDDCEVCHNHHLFLTYHIL